MEVRKDLCTGCGFCIRVCPFGAITLRYGKAAINPEKCADCQTCGSICAVHAIQPIYFDDVANLRRSLSNLHQRTHWISVRIDRLTAGYRRGE